MNKRDYLQNIKKYLGIAGKLRTKTIGQKDEELKLLQKEKIKNKIEESKKTSKREYMENVKRSVRFDIKNENGSS